MSKILLLAYLVCVSYKPIVLDPNYSHDRWQTQPKDIVRHFRAYTVSFDGPDKGDRLNVPEWVSYEIKPLTRHLGKGPERPSPWIHEKGVSPADDSYRGSGFDRGHLCQKYHAFRLGANADWNTHTTLNACPQYPAFNRGIWLDLESKCADWADEFQESIWIITGPVFYNLGSVKWIGDDNEETVAIPQGFFKIIIRQHNSMPHVMALLYPHHSDYPQKGPYYHSKYLVSVDYVEMLTGLDFFTELPIDLEKRLESRRGNRLWGEMYLKQMAK